MWVVIGIVAILAILIFFAVRRANFLGKTTSIYYDPQVKPKLDALYEEKLAEWPVPYETRYVDTKYGRVHVIVSGPEGAPSMLLLHAASVTSMSWIDNVAALSENYRVYAIDTIGEPGRSELKDVNHCPQSGQDLADLYTDITKQLGVERAYMVGASYGGFITTNYALYAPERVEKIALLGPMGVTPNTGNVIIKLTLFTFYPVEPFKAHMVSWSFGDNPSLEWYFKYFRLVLDGVQGRFYAPMTFKPEELQSVQAPTLLVLGEKDNLVGDPAKVSQYAHNVPDIQIEMLDTGHLIGAEQPDKVNQLVLDFFER
jgi:pimeloyl-ACP methyl ester carboxylesterase